MTTQRRIGIILPSENEVFEQDIERLVLDDVSFQMCGVPPTGSDAEAPAKSNNAIEECARSLTAAGMDILTCCTSGGTQSRLGNEQEVIQHVQSVTSVPVVATSMAELEALRALRCNNVCVITPYSDDINRAISSFLEDNGFQVTCMAGRGLDWENVAQIGEDSPDEIFNFALSNFNFALSDLNADVDGILLSCSEWQALAAVERLEQATGKPVVSSNQATIWAALQKLGRTEPIQGYGQLFSEPAAVGPAAAG